MVSYIVTEVLWGYRCCIITYNCSYMQSALARPRAVPWGGACAGGVSGYAESKIVHWPSHTNFMSQASQIEDYIDTIHSTPQLIITRLIINRVRNVDSLTRGFPMVNIGLCNTTRFSSGGWWYIFIVNLLTTSKTWFASSRASWAEIWYDITCLIIHVRFQ